MNWFKRKFRKWIMDYEPAAGGDDPYGSPIAKNAMVGGGTLNSEPTMTFTIYSAVGGKVVEFRRYDRRTDRSDHTVYVIPGDEDFGTRISKIATLESLKN
jgi:hypothetical protein